ncbi:MAG: DUF3325 family protein [Burkholderiaceae bacterium]
MLTALSLVLSLLGFACLAFAMDRHHSRLSRRLDPGRWPLRIAGSALLLASLACAIAGSGLATGFVVWTGMLSPGALAVAALLGLGRRH